MSIVCQLGARTDKKYVQVAYTKVSHTHRRELHASITEWIAGRQWQSTLVSQAHEGGKETEWEVSGHQHGNKFADTLEFLPYRELKCHLVSPARPRNGTVLCSMNGFVKQNVQFEWRVIDSRKAGAKG